MVPRQMGETRVPQRPSCRYSIVAIAPVIGWSKCSFRAIRPDDGGAIYAPRNRPGHSRATASAGQLRRRSPVWHCLPGRSSADLRNAVQCRPFQQQHDVPLAHPGGYQGILTLSGSLAPALSPESHEPQDRHGPRGRGRLPCVALSADQRRTVLSTVSSSSRSGTGVGISAGALIIGVPSAAFSSSSGGSARSSW